MTELVIHKSALSANRLRWACRRGMLELDIFLGEFLDRSYEALPDKEKIIFQDLLLEADQTLLGYFMGQDKPEDLEIVIVVEKIRHTASA